MSKEPSITAGRDRDGTWTIYIDRKVYASGLTKEEIEDKRKEALHAWKENTLSKAFLERIGELGA